MQYCNIPRMMKWIILSFCVFLCSAQLLGTFARASESTENKDEYDFSWLDPDKKIYVVQNRKYTKANSLELVLSGGIAMGQAFRSSYIFMPRAFYYFNESWGISGMGGFIRNSENDAAVAVKQQSSTIVNVRDVKGFAGGSVVWLPFYGKLNIFNQIFYIDWHWELGVASVSSEVDLNTSSTGAPKYVDTTHMGLYWGTGQKFFITRHWAARLDFLAMYYKASIASKGVVTSNESTESNYYLTLGMSYTF